MIAIIVMITFTDGRHLSSSIPTNTRGKSDLREDEQREKARKNRARGRMIEKESDGEKRRPSLQSDRSHPIFSRSRSRRIESTSDILRRLVDVARTSLGLLIPTILTAFVRWSTPWGMIGVVCDPGYWRVCVFTSALYVCVRARLYHRASLPVHPSVGRPIGRSTSRFAPHEREKENERQRRADSASFVIRSHGRTRDWGGRSYLRDGRNFMSYNGQCRERAHTIQP